MQFDILNPFLHLTPVQFERLNSSTMYQFKKRALILVKPATLAPHICETSDRKVLVADPPPLPPSSPPSAGQFLSFLPLESQCPTHPVSYSLTDLTFPRRFLKDNVPLEILLSLKYFFWFQSLSGLEDERCLPPRGSSCHCPFRCCLLGSCSFSILLKSHT